MVFARVEDVLGVLRNGMVSELVKRIYLPALDGFEEGIQELVDVPVLRFCQGGLKLSLIHRYPQINIL